MIRIETDPFPSNAQLEALWLAAWGNRCGDYAGQILPRSLVHIGAFDGDRLIGFVNVAWDGGVHAFVLDTCVDPHFQRRGTATQIVKRAAEVARERGAQWLHVDCEPQLEGFYRGCGFGPTSAGVMRL